MPALFCRAALAAALAVALPAAAQTWTKIANTPSFTAGSAFLLTDGTVLVHVEAYVGSQPLSPDFWRLTPDKTGSYVNGTWSQIASLPKGYAPVYFGSAVLPDGRLLLNGGEDNLFFNGAETTLGAIYDPLANSWTSVKPPAGWQSIGDASALVLPSGRYMLANTETAQEALLNTKTFTWTPTGKGKADANSEEGWTLLPDGSVLAVDVFDSQGGTQHAENYVGGTWHKLPDVPVQLADGGYEIGPQMLRPDGTVFCTGATGHTAIFDTTTKTFTAGPDFPKVGGQQQDVADGPAALLVNGDVLVVASPGDYNNGLHIYEFDGKALTMVPNLQNGATRSSFMVRLLPLPNGQVLATSGTNDVEIFTPAGGAQAAWAPTIIRVASTLTRGQTYGLKGTLLNGLSEAVAYGDDYSAATNYPLVRLTNVASGHVIYARTSHYGTAVANHNPSTTQVLIPGGAEPGATMLELVANGIASKPVSVTIQ